MCCIFKRFSSLSHHSCHWWEMLLSGQQVLLPCAFSAILEEYEELP